MNNINKKSLKNWIGKIHLWLGLASGIVVFIISITGCLYAFKEEIESLTQSYRYINEEKKTSLLPTEISKITDQQLPGKHAHSITYHFVGESAEVLYYGTDPDYFYIVYVNPFTGEVLKVKDMKSDFFHIVLQGHFYLWLPANIGQPIVATATLIFVIMIISGMILWWPKSKNGLKQRFAIKWNARWRRRNYDLHNILGFYIFFVVLVIALTGLVWGFEWFSKSIYFTVSGGKELVSYYESTSDTTLNLQKSNLAAEDKVLLKLKSENPKASEIEVHYLDNNKSVVAANVNDAKGLYWKKDFRYFDQYTLKELNVNHIWGRFKNAKSADKLLRMNYDIHVGAIIGLPGKILAFCVSLISASLPLTGFLIWRGRKKKERKAKGKIKNKNYQIATSTI